MSIFEIEIEIEIDKSSSTMLEIEIEIDKDRSTVHEILIEIDKLININVKPRPNESREPPDHSDEEFGAFIRIHTGNHSVKTDMREFVVQATSEGYYYSNTYTVFAGQKSKCFSLHSLPKKFALKHLSNM